MKQKIFKIGLITLYVFIWLIFILSFLFTVAVLSDLSKLAETKKWWLVLVVVILPFFSAYLLRQQIRYLMQLAWRQKLILSIALIAIGLFYWLQIRPAQIYSKCNRQAQEDAMKMTKAIAEAEDSDYYKEMSEKGFYLTRDYDSAYTHCLRERGISK